MLFNSPIFIFVFLPLTVAGFFALARVPRAGQRLAIGWAAFASLVFYGWWDARYVFLLLASILFNYVCGVSLARRAAAGHPSRGLLGFAIGGNLALLGLFKYADFFVGSWNAATGAHLPLLHIVLPLGISFFTFTQIAFLVDAYRGIAREYDFVHYLLFVTYFPAPDRWARPAPQGDDAAVLRSLESRAAAGELRGRTHHFLHRAVQESRTRRRHRRARGPGLRRDRAANALRRVERCARIHLPAVLRLLGLLGHGHWPLASVRSEATAQFRFALPVGLDRGILASLAHDPVAIPARLPLFLPRGATGAGRRAAM